MRGDQRSGSGKRRNERAEEEPAGHEPSKLTSYDVTFRELLKLYRELSRDGTAPQVTDAITQALLTVLGSGPSFAALESMVSANQANGLMYHNSVSLQQKTNILGMVATAKCVKALLNLKAEWPDIDPDDEEGGA